MAPKCFKIDTQGTRKTQKKIKTRKIYKPVAEQMLFLFSLLPFILLLFGFAALGPATLRHSDAKKGPAGTAKRLQ